MQGLLYLVLLTIVRCETPAIADGMLESCANDSSCQKLLSGLGDVLGNLNGNNKINQGSRTLNGNNNQLLVDQVQRKDQGYAPSNTKTMIDQVQGRDQGYAPNNTKAMFDQGASTNNNKVSFNQEYVPSDTQLLVDQNDITNADASNLYNTQPNNYNDNTNLINKKNELCQNFKVNGCYHGGNPTNPEKENVFPACWIPAKFNSNKWSCYHIQANTKQCEDNQIDIRQVCQEVEVYQNFYRYENMPYDGFSFIKGRKYIPAPEKIKTGRGQVYQA